MLIISQKRNCHFVSNHFEFENDIKMTLKRRSYPRYLWARQLVTSSNVCKCIEPLGPRVNPGQLTAWSLAAEQWKCGDGID